MKMKTLIALALVAFGFQTHAARIVDGRLDLETKKVHLVLEIDNACNQPKFAIVSNFCNKRIDGPCHYKLVPTIANRMACPRKLTLVHRVIDAPAEMLSPRLTIVLSFGEGTFVLQQSDFWKR
jgi:hypothetical protein